jgi:hypothetical protein
MTMDPQNLFTAKHLAIVAVMALVIFGTYLKRRHR